uniref:Uncharacterized protein n=1 Tax=Pipistrellus kuhlii TaxID=59472 RepID=A0A7J7S6V4_PIPKU|nr:hypothetical protein mPipKuh1_010026 [Pipistrellus kuhlii]
MLAPGDFLFALCTVLPAGSVSRTVLWKSDVWVLWPPGFRPESGLGGHTPSRFRQRLWQRPPSLRLPPSGAPAWRPQASQGDRSQLLRGTHLEAGGRGRGRPHWLLSCAPVLVIAGLPPAAGCDFTDCQPPCQQTAPVAHGVAL